MPRCIVLIVIDCLRADHLSSNGYERDTTPIIDGFAAKGVTWDRAYSASSWTKPSVTSMLTGLFPSQHGAFQGVKRSKGRMATTDVLSPEHLTMAEALSTAGWRCGAFLNNDQLDTFTGLNRGFDTYDSQAGKADQILQRFDDWLGAGDGRPIFAYLHFLEAHWPYKPRRRHIAMFGGDRDSNHFRDYRARDYGQLRKAISRGESDMTAEQRHQMIQMYDGAIRRLDGKIRIALSTLKERGLYDDSVIAITADHGEEFQEHGHIGHGHSLYDELTHVPLIICGSGAPAGQRRTTPVSQVDLARTLLDRAGVHSDLPGVDLCTSASGRPVVTELRIRRRYTQTLRDERWKVHRQFAFEPGDEVDVNRLSIQDMMATLPHSTTTELYDVAADPRETNDVSAHPDGTSAAFRLTADLDQWWSECAASCVGAQSDCEIDDQVVQRLRDLGYID